MKKEFEQWAKKKGRYFQLASDGSYVSMTLNQEFEAWQGANQRFADFIEQAIHDSACAEERQTLQRLLEDFNATLK